MTAAAADATTYAIEQVANIIAESTEFRASVGESTNAGARKFIHKSYYHVPDELIDFPYAVIFEAAGARWERLSDGTQLPRGELFLHLCRPMEADHDPENEERDFNNWHGQIAEDISVYYGEGYRLLTTIADPPTRTHPKDQGATTPVWEVGYSVAWSAFG